MKAGAARTGAALKETSLMQSMTFVAIDSGRGTRETEPFRFVLTETLYADGRCKWTRTGNLGREQIREGGTDLRVPGGISPEKFESIKAHRLAGGWSLSP